MKHYWVLGLLGVGFYGIFQFSRGEWWFQENRHNTHDAVVAERTVSSGNQDFLWTGDVAHGRTLEIKGINGGVIARGGSGDEVVVRATKRSRRGNTADVQIEVVEHSGGVTVCAMYPSRESRNVCAPGEAGRMSSRNSDVNVDFEVSVPRGIAFIGRTVNGGVRVETLEGPVEAHTVNGSITVSAAGPVRAATVNGSIETIVDRTTVGGDVRLETVNGRVVLALPANANADVSGSTSNGRITSEFPLTISGRFGPKQVSGMLGSGGDNIRLQSVNGSISVVRRGGP